jgi:DNA-binding MarR family transcriptional regulator/GNAT superfamily N-acetyltransferase
MNDDAIALVRRFNRLVTQRAGALDADYLGRPRPLAASRLLFEIGPETVELRALRERLGLDAGYLTRLVQTLTAEGLVRTGRSPGDRRQRTVRRTPAGRREVLTMDAQADARAAQLLSTVGASQSGRLLAAMDTVCALLRVASLDVACVDPDGSVAHWCLQQYFAELRERFDGGFDPGRSIPMPTEALVPPYGAFLVASIDGAPVACGALRTMAPQVGYLKRMWVDQSVRGLGVGRRMLNAIETQARALGFHTLRLETNRALPEAISLYRRAGYREVTPFNDEPYSHHWFEKGLVE